MDTLLFAEGQVGFSNWILPAILILVIVFYIASGFIRRSKYNNETQDLLSKLQVGTKIKTFAGIYGEIVEIRDALDGSKVALIKTGEGDKCSYMSIDLASVYAIDEKDNAELFAEETTDTTETLNIEAKD